LGIDGAAHKGALAAGGAAQTIAVLGAGLQQVYPQRHRNLARQIVNAGGLLVSEYPASRGPRPFQFPERNRLISGVSLATVVVEASDRSGSLITARFAAEQGRDVMAMPGPVQSFVSNGCHRLIQQGAGLVTDATQVIANAGIEQQALLSQPTLETASVKLSETSQQIVDCLQGYAVTLDEIMTQTQIPTRELTCALVELELLGFVQQGPLGYIRTS
jgi:DNA processing protein